MAHRGRLNKRLADQRESNTYSLYSKSCQRRCRTIARTVTRAVSRLPRPDAAVIAQEFSRQFHWISSQHLAHCSNALLRRQRGVRASHIRLYPSRAEYHNADSAWLNVSG